MITFLVCSHLGLQICGCFLWNLALQYSGEIRTRFNVNCLTVNNLLVSFFLWILYRFDTLRTQDKEPFKDYTLSTKTLTFEIVLGLIDCSDNRDGNFFRELHLLAVN